MTYSTFFRDVIFCAVCMIAMTVLIILDRRRRLSLSQPGFVYPAIALLPAIIVIIMVTGMLALFFIPTGLAKLNDPTLESNEPGAVGGVGDVVFGIIGLLTALAFSAFILYLFVKSNKAPLFSRGDVSHGADNASRAARRLGRYGLVSSLIYQVPVTLALIVYGGALITEFVQHGLSETFDLWLFGPALIFFMAQFVPSGIALDILASFLITVICVGCFATWVWSLNAALRAIRADAANRVGLIVCAVFTFVPLANTIALIIICRLMTKRIKSPGTTSQ